MKKAAAAAKIFFKTISPFSLYSFSAKKGRESCIQFVSTKYFLTVSRSSFCGHPPPSFENTQKSARSFCD
ncbi:MAG TPA: hypothetical protein DCR31_03920 [Ruminococcaceae bacterium]|nr:hypothetical protein [Oscillospiraceae bacterium]